MLVAMGVVVAGNPYKMEGIECEICNRKFSSEKALNQHNSTKHPKGEKNLNWRKYSILIIIGLILVLFILSISAYIKKPGEYDNFVKCLTEKNVVIYGNDFCSYTVKQLNFFGKSKEHFNYIKCIDNKVLCDSKGVSITPTWEINGEMYGGIQGFEKLSILSGCRI